LQQPSQTTAFERKIFSRRFLVLFDAKKKEPFGGGEPRQDCAVRQKKLHIFHFMQLFAQTTVL